MKVVVLFSGSLASRVAGRLVQRHPDVGGVQLLHFRSPFSSECGGLRDLLREEWFGTTFRTQSLKRDYRRFVDSRVCFSLRRACVQCRTLLLARAARYVERVGADFLVTGDRLDTWDIKASDLQSLDAQFGLTGRVLRPLCASWGQTPERVDEWAVLDAPRRGRPASDEDLMAAASGLGLESWDGLCAAQRCKLTVPGFGERVARLLAEESFTLNALRLLDFAHVYRAEPDVTIVLAEGEDEKHQLQDLFLPGDLRVYPSTPHGPVTLVRTAWDAKNDAERSRVVALAARITATHSAPGRPTTLPICFRWERDDETQVLNAQTFASWRDLLDEPGVTALTLGAPIAAAP
ncbi:MAG: hypothetical protein AB1778_08420 [Candidatus Bipolaricaulota bacterium]